VYRNTQVTFDASTANARSESAITVNPVNPLNVVGSSKRFTNPQTYDFSLAAYASFDGGTSWTEAAPLGLQPGWAGVSDPTLAWDAAGNVYLVGLAFGAGANTLIGMAIYRSTDGGQTWSAPNLIHQSPGDDKQWAAGDNNPASPHYGNVYVVWDDLPVNSGDPWTCAFARTLDSGATWSGTAGQGAGSALGNNSFAPQVSVASDGTVYVVWLTGSDVMFVKSTDGGGSFTGPVAAVQGITPLTSPPLPAPGGFPELPGGHFRVLSIAACTAGSGQDLVLAWADYREGVSRVYYAYSNDAGASWPSAPSGQPLLSGTDSSGADQQDFHAQLATLPDGSIGCAFYEFGVKWPGGPPLIDVELAVSTDKGGSFGNRQTVTDRAWDPTIDAPWSHGDPQTTFIGDYFGLAGSPNGWSVFWTDTRTGVQEMYFGSEKKVGPWSGVQWTDTIDPNATLDFFTWGWPASWDVLWTPMATTPDGATPQISWKIQVERSSPYFLTYHIVITNLTDMPVGIEGRYTILAM
jgi:hypothetical protein